MKSTHEKAFEKAVEEWAAADKECTRLYLLWNEACQRRRVLARAKNQVWRDMEIAGLESRVGMLGWKRVSNGESV